MNLSFRQTNFNPLLLAVVILSLLVCAALLIFSDAVISVLFLIGGVLFVLLVRNPEVALAIQFNGIMVYLYLIYKAGLEPGTLMTGSFYGLMAISYLAGGVHLYARGWRNFRFNSTDTLFVALFTMFFASYLLFSRNNPYAFQKVIYAPLLVIAPYFGIQLLATLEQVKRFFTCCGLMAALLIIPSFYELFFNPLYNEYGRFSIYVFNDRGDNPIQFGITFALLLIVVLFHLAARKRIRWFQALLIIPSVYLLLRSGARGPLISFLVTVIFYVFSLGGLRSRVKVFILMMLLGLMVGAYRFIPENTASFYQDLLDPESQVRMGSSIQERLFLMNLAVDEFLDNPLFGVGTGNSSGGIGYPHNVLVEMAAEFGVIGLTMFLALCLVTIRRAKRFLYDAAHEQDDWLMNLAFSFFIFSLVEAFFSSYMGGDMQLYGSVGLVSVVAKLKEQWQSQTQEVPAEFDVAEQVIA
ncbi:MAG TPA: O-antigen ligase family protein [Blastocatellia bacterium]|nr:O-antigen ligase family protein [Blastocatellia bacterium]